MFRTSFFVLTSTRETVPSPWLSVQMAPPPAVMKRGRDPTSTLSVRRFVFGSTRTTMLFSVLETQTAPSSPATQVNEPDGTCISATTLFVSGSILERMPLRSLSIHTLSALVAIPPSLSAGPAEIVAATSFVFISTRESVWSPQFGTHMLPKHRVLRAVGHPNSILSHHLPVGSSLDGKHGLRRYCRDLPLHARLCDSRARGFLRVFRARDEGQKKYCEGYSGKHQSPPCQVSASTW